MDDEVLGLTPHDAGRVGKMLRNYESGGMEPPRRPRPPMPTARDSNTAILRNDSGELLEAGSVLEITDEFIPSEPLIDDEIQASSDLPAMANGFGITLSRIGDGDSGPCQISGVCMALVNVTDASHRYATPASGESVLQSAITGPVRILVNPSGTTGETPCFIRLQQVSSSTDVDIVQVHHVGGETAGSTVSANGDGLHAGVANRVIGGVMTSLGQCWILFVDGFDTVAGLVSATQDDYYGPARLCDTFTSGAVNLPLYVCRKGGAAAESGIPFLNNSGATIQPHAIMQVETTVLTDKNYVSVITPDETFWNFYLVNGSTAIPSLGTGLGNWLFENSGPVLLGDDTPLPAVGHEFGPKPGRATLFPYRLGFMTLGAEYTHPVSGLTVVDCKQRFINRVFGKLYGSDLTQNNAGNATAEFEIHLRGADGKWHVGLWDKITVYASFLNKQEVVKVGTKGWADWYDDYWEGDFACDVDNTDSAGASPGANQSFVSNEGGSQSFNFTQGVFNSSTGVGTGTF